jgi:hypothetical protein
VYAEKQNQLHLLDELCSFCCYIMCLLQNLGGDGWMGTLNIHFTNPGIKFMWTPNKAAQELFIPMSLLQCPLTQRFDNTTN